MAIGQRTPQEVWLLTGDGDDYLAGASVVAELAEVDALPCAEIKTAVGYRDS